MLVAADPCACATVIAWLKSILGGLERVVSRGFARVGEIGSVDRREHRRAEPFAEEQDAPRFVGGGGGDEHLPVVARRDVGVGPAFEERRTWLAVTRAVCSGV